MGEDEFRGIADPPPISTAMPSTAGRRDGAPPCSDQLPIEPPSPACLRHGQWTFFSERMFALVLRDLLRPRLKAISVREVNDGEDDRNGSGGQGIDASLLIAGAATGITAYISIAFLMRYFRRHDFQALNPFAYYCWVAGATAFVALVVL